MASEDALEKALDVVRGIQAAVSKPSVTPASQTQAAPPSELSVFISWAHQHQSWSKKQTRAWQESVATFASMLRQEFGIDADIDLFHLDEPTDWTRYGQRAVIDSSRVIIVHSKAWAERWEGTNAPTEGAGAAREADALHGLFSRNQQEWQQKLLIVQLPDVSIEDLPPDLDRVARVRVDPSDLDSYEDLLRNLTGQPKYAKPPLGITPVLPPLHSDRNLANLRGRLAEVKKQEREAGKSKSDDNARLREQLSMHESALRGFIETALQDDD